MSTQHPCVVCGAEMVGSHLARKYCSTRCKARWFKEHASPTPVTHHDCRYCGAQFPIGPHQRNKWLCSPACQRLQNNKSVREHHARRPLAEAANRARSREKALPDSQNVRFYRNNPDAPRACQSCGEARVVEIAHRPEHARFGARRSVENCRWPEKVWVLCPTCHRLLDRMRYAPIDLGLS